MSPSDPELMARVAAGEEEAFALLHARHAGRLRAHLRAVVRDPEAAEDLMQETFLRLWTRAAQWSGDGSLGAWLGRTATHLALNWLRARRRRPELPLEPPADPGDEPQAPGWLIDAGSLGPEQVAELAEERALVRDWLDELPADKQAVVRLLCEADLTLREVAANLGIPEGTVKSRLHYATRRLAARWQEQQEGDW